MRALFVVAALLGATPAAAQLAPVAVDHIDLVQSRPLTRTRYEYVYRVTAVFNGAPGTHSPGAHNLRAAVTSSAPTTVISDGDLSFDSVLTGAKVASSDTFSIVQDRTRPFDRSALSFAFQYDEDVAVLPSLQGMTQAQAVAALVACCGVSVNTFFHSNDPEAAPGTVVQTDPPEGTPLSELSPEPYSYVDVYLSSGPDHTSQFGVTLALNQLSVERGDSLPLQLHIDRTPGFSDPISLELEAPPTGYSANAFSVGPEFPTPRLTVFTDPSVYLFTELMVRASAGGQSVHIPLRVSPIPRSPSSAVRIKSALAAGTINLETSYLYRLYSMMGDPRLPAEFSGRRRGGEDLQLLRDIRDQESSFSSETRALLHPYLVRPSDPASIWSQRLAASTSAQPARFGPIATAEPTVTILSEQACPAVVQDPTWINKRVTARGTDTLLWVRCDPADPEFSQLTMGAYLDALTTALGPMIDMMGPPLPDLGGSGASGPFDPDGAIDIYVLPEGLVAPRADGRSLESWDALGLMNPIDVGVGQSPRMSGYIQVGDETVSSPDGSAHNLLIHELFHLLEAAHNGHVIKAWIEEACAKWAETHFDYLLPWSTRSAGLVHVPYFTTFRSNFDLALNEPDPERTTGAYRSYLWFFYMQRRLGRQSGADVVAALWRKLETFPAEGSNADIDAVLDGLFPYADHFPDFARLNVLSNDFLPGDPVPETASYHGLDPSQFPLLPPFTKGDYGTGPSPNRHYIAGDGGGANDSSDPFDLKPLQTDYLYIDVTGSFTREVDVTWDGPSPQGSLTVDSVARVRDHVFKVERVRTRNGITYCIPEGAEDQALLGYLIFSNGGYRPEQDIVQEKVTVTRTSRPTALCGCANPPAGAQYCAEALRTPDTNSPFPGFVTGINHYGAISGSEHVQASELPVVWASPSSLVPLAASNETRTGSASRINDDGQVAGYFKDSSGVFSGNAAFWPNSGGVLSPVFLPLPYPTWPFGQFWDVFVALNNQSAVAYSTNRHVYIRQYNGASVSEVDAGPGDAALDLNEYNHLLVREGGRYSVTYPASDSLWRSGVRTPLPILAEALNDDDVVVGEWVDPASPPDAPIIRPARWKDGAMTLLDLPPAPLPTQTCLCGPASILFAFATDINNRGEIVGYVVYHYPALNPRPGLLSIDVSRGLHWAPDGHVIFLDDAIPAYAGVQKVTAINDLGWMAGMGIVLDPSQNCRQDPLFDCGGDSPVRLTPVRP